MAASNGISASKTLAPKCVNNEDAGWVEALLKMNAAKPLIQHFAASEAIHKYGCQKGAEPPIDQASTWKRLFCWNYSKTDTPFGIVSPLTSTLPKCIAICNLSGVKTFYYSDNFSLGRLLCLSSQAESKRIISGMQAVFERAVELDASVLVLFCLPFQTGIERVYWEARTIRKTSEGVVKDGEMFYSVNDRDPRHVPCTLESEHWPDSMFDELSKTFTTVVSPVCLDKTEFPDPLQSQMSLDQALSMICMLKAERKKLMDEHRRATEAAKSRALDEVSRLTGLVKEAESKADARVASVAAASKVAENTIKKKFAAVDEHNASLMKQIATQKTAVDDYKARMTGMMLEREQEGREAAARQKTLESQVSSLQSSHAKQVSEQTRARKDLVKLHQAEVAELKRLLEESRKQIASTASAATLVTKSADEARRAKAETETSLKTALEELSSVKQEIKAITESNVQCMKTHEELTAKLEGARDTLASTEARASAAEGTLAESNAARQCLLKTVEEIEEARVAAEEKGRSQDAQVKTSEEESSVTDTVEEKDAAVTVLSEEELAKLKAAEEELGIKDHLLKETEKRAKALECRIRELEADLKEAKNQHGASVPNQPANCKGQAANGAQKRRGKADCAADDSSGQAIHPTMPANQNTVYAHNGAMHPPQHQPGFPANGNFVVDPMLEGMISQLHSALQTITAAARSATSSSRAAEIAQAKLNALSAAPTMGPYYDVSQHPQQMQFFPRRDGY